MNVIPWNRIEPTIATGDLIAFGGTDPIARAIQGLCRGPVDHVGVVLRLHDLVIPRQQEAVVLLAEAVRPHARLYPLDRRLLEHEGEAWWLSLGPDVAKRCDFRRMRRHMLASLGRSYHEWQVARAMRAEAWSRHDHAQFCAQFAAECYEAGGVVGKTIDCSAIDPVGLCTWALWSGRYHYIMGDDLRELPGFNTLDVR